MDRLYYDEFLKDFEGILDSFISHDSEKKHDNFQDTVEVSLRVFSQFPDSEAVSLFLINESTMDFDHIETYPPSYVQINNSLFYLLINKDIVSSVIETRQHKFFIENEPSLFNNCFLIPLTTIPGVFGFVLIKLMNNYKKTDELIIKSFLAYSSLLAFKLDNILLHNLKESVESTLEQKVAIRTMILAQGKRELQTIFNSLPAGVFVCDPESNIITNSNFFALQLLDEVPENVVGKNINNFFDVTELEKELEKDNNISSSFETNLLKNSTPYIPVIKTSSNINLGSFKFKIISFIDISDRKKAEDALQNANELLELKVKERTEDLQILIHRLKQEINIRKNAEREIFKVLEKEKELGELKTKFISLVSHEFKTPLSVISSAAQIQKQFIGKHSEEEQIHYIERILNTVKIISDLLDNVIFMGKSESGFSTVRKNNFNIVELSKTVINDLMLTFSSKRNINFIYHVDNEEIYTDEMLIRNIIVNLLANSIKYSDEEKEIVFDLQSDNKTLSIFVKDNGIGIPQEAQEKIFLPFYRAENVGNKPGTGLGMSVIMRSLQALDGNIEMESRENIGTEFKVIIPLSD